GLRGGPPALPADLRAAAPAGRAVARRGRRRPPAERTVDGHEQRLRGGRRGGGDGGAAGHGAVRRGAAGGRGMIELSDHAEGCVLPVRAQPGARRTGIQGEQNGALKVAVSAPAEDGRANQALVEVLREELELKRSQVELIAGHTARDKRFLVRGLSREELQQRLGRALAP